MRLSFLVSLLAATVLAIVTAAQQPPRFDVLLINGRIVDGTGAPWFRGDVGIVVDWRTLGDYLRRLDLRSRPAINVGTFVGAGGIRNYVIGKDDRPATPAELERMKQLVAEAMQQGALGLSTSLQYVPDRFASTDEVVALAKVAARHGGVYFTHQRSESSRMFESLDEVFAIAERAAIPAEIWHLKTAYKANFGKMPDVLKRIEAARARGLDVTANQYPYTRASNGLDSCLPLWSREGGLDKTLVRLKDPATRERIKTDMDDPNATTWENQWYGAKAEDGRLSENKSHPRAWGSFPRILGRYVRDEHLLTLEEAIRKMTSKAAARVHMTDRGVLRPGMMADITVFDPATIRDVATFEDPNRYSVGIRHVFVNGRRVVADGTITAERPGRPLRGPGYRN